MELGLLVDSWWLGKVTWKVPMVQSNGRDMELGTHRTVGGLVVVGEGGALGKIASRVMATLRSLHIATVGKKQTPRITRKFVLDLPQIERIDVEMCAYMYPRKACRTHW
jgi:hypothetical protein